jgi:hypothetical protein
MASEHRVLIVGFGKMGRIHAKHLSEMHVAWSYHDPFLPGGVAWDRWRDFTHAIIATPISTHYEVYRQLDAFRGRILIEKPVVVRPEHLAVLDDPRVFPGMCERFNPAVEALRARVRPEEIVRLEFCRTSPNGDPADVGIHDLDLFCHFLDLQGVPECAWEEDEFVAAAGAVRGRFRWPKSLEKRRTVCLATRSTLVRTDLAVPLTASGKASAWPVHRELLAFLGNEERPDARISHRLLVSCLQANGHHADAERDVDRALGAGVAPSVEECCFSQVRGAERGP